jgi:hypothetical protein
LETGGTLSVQALCGGGGREACGQSGSAEFRCAAAGSEDGADGYVFDEVGVDAGALDEGFVGAVEEVGGLCVFEAAFSAFCNGGAEGACYDDLGSMELVDFSHNGVV